MHPDPSGEKREYSLHIWTRSTQNLPGLNTHYQTAKETAGDSNKMQRFDLVLKTTWQLRVWSACSETLAVQQVLFDFCFGKGYAVYEVDWTASAPCWGEDGVVKPCGSWSWDTGVHCGQPGRELHPVWGLCRGIQPLALCWAAPSTGADQTRLAPGCPHRSPQSAALLQSPAAFGRSWQYLVCSGLVSGKQLSHNHPSVS